MSSMRRLPVTVNSPNSCGQSGRVLIVETSSTRTRTPSKSSAIGPVVDRCDGCAGTYGSGTGPEPTLTKSSVR